MTFDRLSMNHTPAALLLALCVMATSAVAADIEAGQAKAMSCAMCHGANGISQMPGAPNLAGQQALYVELQLKNYRSGKRNNEIMNVIAKPLTDTEISNLAAWYESIRIDGTSAR
ncbi:MAG: cytochrome c553 [Burkholderiaceae bacterium]|jgi:cytochrome c553